MTPGDRAYFTDAGGVTHLVTILGLTRKTASIEYLDNDRRGIAYRAGRAHNHATRVRLSVWQSELRPVVGATA